MSRGREEFIVSGGRLHPVKPEDGADTPNVRKPRKQAQAELHREGAYVLVTDLPTAGFLFMEGLTFVNAREAWETQRRKIYEIEFYDPDHKAEKLVIKFMNDRCADFEDHVARIRKVINRCHGRRRYNGDERQGASNARSRKR